MRDPGAAKKSLASLCNLIFSLLSKNSTCPNSSSAQSAGLSGGGIIPLSGFLFRSSFQFGQRGIEVDNLFYQ